MTTTRSANGRSSTNGTLGTSTLVHLVTLPTEIDASFARALPLLDRHNILKSADRPHARRLLNQAVSDKEPAVKAAVKEMLHMR